MEFRKENDITKQQYESIKTYADHTGSRVFGYAKNGSDYDYVIDYSTATEKGIISPDTVQGDFPPYDCVFSSFVFYYNKRRINLIVVIDKTARKAWWYATEKVKELPEVLVRKKSRRVPIFEWFMLKFYEDLLLTDHCTYKQLLDKDRLRGFLEI